MKGRLPLTSFPSPATASPCTQRCNIYIRSAHHTVTDIGWISDVILRTDIVLNWYVSGIRPEYSVPSDF
jgi:hypothetical protein